jgi:dihydrofolate reductase
VNPRSAPAISLVAAVAANRVIGNKGSLPWRIPGDLPRFRRLTMGHPVIMGRATFLSLGRPLSGRTNIVLTRDPSLRIAGCTIVHSREEALDAAGGGADPPGGAGTADPTRDEAFVIGGASVYALFLPIAARMYITWVDAEVPGDTLFPHVVWSEWQVQSETAGNPASGPGPAVLPHRFVDYVRREK